MKYLCQCARVAFLILFVFLCERPLFFGFTVVARGAEGRQGMILIDFVFRSPPIDQIVIFVDRGSALFDGNGAFELV